LFDLIDFNFKPAGFRSSEKIDWNAVRAAGTEEHAVVAVFVGLHILDFTPQRRTIILVAIDGKRYTHYPRLNRACAVMGTAESDQPRDRGYRIALLSTDTSVQSKGESKRTQNW
jgi:hypothetical protein